mgnify:CR=1 FL=1
MNLENQALRACLEVGKALTSTLELKGILDLIMSKVSDLIAAGNWSLLLRDEKTGELGFEIVVGLRKETVEGIRLKRGEGIAGHVAETGIPVFSDNLNENENFSGRIDDITGFRTKSIVCVPMKVRDRVLGVIEIVNVAEMKSFEKKYVPVLTILADYGAIAIENAWLFERVRRMTVTDEYTGLYNARYLHDVLDKLIDEARERESRLAIAFIDMDNFKKVVDTHGHLAGSRVLSEVGQVMSSCLSSSDILIKYGGDEFVLLMPGRDSEDAVRFVESIREAVRSASYLASGEGPVRLTASFGIAVFPTHGMTKRDLLSRADQAMYRAKESTKDRVCSF